MSDAQQNDLPDVESLSFEQAQAELEHVVERLEDQHTGLDEALQLWERGEALHQYCQRKLDAAAARIERLQVTPEEAAAVVAEGGDDFAQQPAGAAPIDGTQHEMPAPMEDAAAPAPAAPAPAAAAPAAATPAAPAPAAPAPAVPARKAPVNVEAPATETMF